MAFCKEVALVQVADLMPGQLTSYCIRIICSILINVNKHIANKHTNITDNCANYGFDTW